MGACSPQVSQRDGRGGAVPARDGRRGRDVLTSDLGQYGVHGRHRFGGVGRALPSGAERAEGDRAEARGGRSSALRVGDADPRAVRVLGVVEPIAADVIAREDVAGDQRSADPEDPRGEQVLLDLGGRASWA